LATSSATIKQEETHPVRATHTIFAIHRVIAHGIAIFSVSLCFCSLIKTQKIVLGFKEKSTLLIWKESKESESSKTNYKGEVKGKEKRPWGRG
jgi:hypothetical protein